MKKILLYITLPFIGLMIASLYIRKPVHTGMHLATDVASNLLFVDTLTVPSAIDDELRYYFERHNVEDEGYEMVVAFANGKRHHVSVGTYVPVRNIGTWRGYDREGSALILDTEGRTIIGTCHADTVETGVRIDSIGTYMGDFSQMKAHGHGAYHRPNGDYAEGHWEDDRQHGFGLELLQPDNGEPHLRVGDWTTGRFMGERMRYTTERIYGIDIARYQHGKGRKVFPIRWDQMRITWLGKKGSRNVSGTADYPVSFLYIKSTEGTTVRNRYYAGDYVQARKHGIRTGAYHFWSVRTTGADQARFFLQNTRFSKGDLPPVLDVEPSDAQIQQMGGIERMFQHIRVWMNMVQRRTGVRPILYINQMFVNKYLSLAPDIKRDYRVWIARYGEYKPDVRLTYWQLCPDGRVAGIHGEVDINVFNGYKSQFEEFLEEETIK